MEWSGAMVPRCREKGPVDSSDSVHDAVSPRACSEVKTAFNALSPKPSLFKRSLFGDVADLGTGLNAMYGCRVEQILDQLALRLGSEAAISLIGKQCDPDLHNSRHTAFVPGICYSTSIVSVGS